MQSSHPILAREGWGHIAIAGLASLAAMWFGSWWLVLLTLLVLVFVLQFFRDPGRKVPVDSNHVLSPADGKIVFLGPERDPYLDRDSFKISVFMNVFSVHSNRSPISGDIKDRWYHPGKFINAALDKSSTENERNALWLSDHKGRDVVSVQVAGLIARRILCYVDKGDRVSQGQRYGFIRFGSRVDVYLPVDFQPDASLGDWVTAGVTKLGHY